jgi:hypothetical protein
MHLSSEEYIRNLRREFLRAHRRVVVALRTDPEVDVGRLLHSEQATLAHAWREIVMARATDLPNVEWSPEYLIETLDRIVEATPEWVRATYEPESFAPGSSKSLRRGFLRFRAGLARLFRRDLTRRIPFRALLRYHFSGAVPGRLEYLATLLVRADAHLLRRTRNAFEQALTAYERLVTASVDEATLVEELRLVRAELESEMEIAYEEIGHMARAKSTTLAVVFGEGLRGVVADLRVAGTMDLSVRHRRSSKVFHERLHAIGVLTDDLRATRANLAGGYRLLAMELELLALEAKVRDTLEEHVAPIARNVRGRTHLQAQRVETALDEVLVAIDGELSDPSPTDDPDGDPSEDDSDGDDGAPRSGDHLSASLRQVIEPLQKTTADASALALKAYDQLADQDTLTPLFDAIRRHIQALSESYEVPTQPLVFTDPNRLPGPSTIIDVPFRDLVAGHFEGTIAPGIAQESRDLVSIVQPFVSSLQELDRLIDFKLELASAELDAVPDEHLSAEVRDVVREILLVGFDRNREVLHGYVEESDAWAQRLSDEIRRLVIKGFVTLREQIVEGELSQLRMDILRRRAVGRGLIRRASRIPAIVTHANTLAVSTVRSLVGAHRLDIVWTKLGLPVADGPIDAKAFEAPKPRIELPLLYRRLFSTDALDLGGAREAEIDRARAALAATGSALRTVALVGPEGVGKGALLRAVVRSRSWRNVRRIQLDRPVTVEQVEEWFTGQREGTLFVFSGFQWLLSMEPGGFRPLRRFTEGIIADQGRTAWLISADTLVWNYASQAAPLTDAFGDVIRIEPFDLAELESVIIGRHRMSGHAVNFEPARVESWLEDWIIRGAGRIRRPYEAYFRALHDASGGMVRDALALWLASVERIDEREDLVGIGPVPPSPLKALSRLPDDVLMKIYHVARQGWTNSVCQAHLFRLDEMTAEAQLARLAHLGLLQRENDAYTITPHLRAPIHRILDERGWT